MEYIVSVTHTLVKIRAIKLLLSAKPLTVRTEPWMEAGSSGPAQDGHLCLLGRGAGREEGRL